MFKIALKNGKEFVCNETYTVFEGAKNAGIILEHSCLSARCSSCKVQVISGQTVAMTEDSILSEKERGQGYVLSCNVKPTSDLTLNIEDLGDYELSKSKTIPCKIDKIEKVSFDVVKITLRLPPNSNFKYLPGQYVNLIKGNISRSYSIANYNTTDNNLEFLIKNYENGLMSGYWFKEAKTNDLLRLHGPLGTFFFRNKPSKKTIFLATGTGIAPVNSILEGLTHTQQRDKNILVFWGARQEESLFLDRLPLVGVNFYKVLSKPNKEWKGKTGYVQDVLLSITNDLSDCVVYACGSNDMIESAKKVLMANGLNEADFYSDAFVSSN